MRRKLSYREAIAQAEAKLYGKAQAVEPFKLAQQETPDHDKARRERLQLAEDRRASAVKQVTFNFWSV
jgi:hypothetical protein